MANSAIETRHFIDGEFVVGKGTKFESINPASDKVIAHFNNATQEEVDLAVKAANYAFPLWSCKAPKARRQILLKLADLLEQNRKEFAKFESIDSGKPANLIDSFDLELCINHLRYYAGYCDKIYGHTREITPSDDKHYICYTRKEPVGVIGQIIPWNFPLLMFVYKVAPALACGCTVVIKPSEKTPITALMFADLIKQANVPDGVVNIVTGDGNTGDFLVRHPDIQKIAFTGSSAVGKLVAAKAAEYGLKPVSLELGGKSPLIVCEDADLEQAVNVAHKGIFFNMGQCCIASSRVFVHEKIHDKFVDLCVKKASKSKMIDPLDQHCDHGPQIDKAQFDIIMKYIEKGKNEGANIVCGGKQYGSKGYWIEPTIFTNVTDNMEISNNEIFGPVMCILKYASINEAIKRANTTSFGLGAGVCTDSFTVAHMLAEKLKAGTIYINCWNILDSNAPFGGIKESGFGRENAEEGINMYTHIKTVIAQIEWNE